MATWSNETDTKSSFTPHSVHAFSVVSFLVDHLRTRDLTRMILSIVKSAGGRAVISSFKLEKCLRALNTAANGTGRCSV